MDQEHCPPKRKPPPIPKRNPTTCLSGQIPARPSTLSRSLNHDPLKKSPYHNQRQYSATLPRHSQRLDICAELLNYISELTQELMAETSFTEVSLLEEPNEVNNTWSCSKQSSVAIQTEDIPPQNTNLKNGRSIGTQVNKRTATEPDNDKQARIHLERQSPSKPFKTVKKMLKEGSIEGIEDDPPVFKPPPPPTAYVAAQVNVLPKSNEERPKQPPIIRPVSSKVAKCLSTFEPSIDNKLNDHMSFSENQRPFKSPIATKSPKLTVTAPPMSSSALKNSPISSIVSPHRNIKENPKMQKQTRSLAFNTKAETVDHCFNQRLSPAVSEKQIQISNTPPPPPIGKQPPPKIVVEVPPKKHRQSSSCGTTCSCLCLKRQSPCGSPVSPSMGSHPQSSPFTPMKNANYPTPKTKPDEKVQFTTGGVSARDEAYNALIEEIRFAIKRRQNGDDKEEDALS